MLVPYELNCRCSSTGLPGQTNYNITARIALFRAIECPMGCEGNLVGTQRFGYLVAFLQRLGSGARQPEIGEYRQ